MPGGLRVQWPYLTDALESIVNVIAGLVGLYSLSIAYKPRDTNHPYGHGKAEFLSAAIEGTLIMLAGVFIIYEAMTSAHSSQRIATTQLRYFTDRLFCYYKFYSGFVCRKKRKGK